MSLKVTFDGYDITTLLKVTSLDRGFGGNRENRVTKIGRSRGETYLDTTIDSDVIPMGYVLILNLIEKRRELGRILNVDEPKKLIFSDEPDKFYLAIPSEKIKTDENNYLGFGTINWLVPDGVAHAVDEQVDTNEAGNPNLITIDNLGSEATYPSVEVEIMAETGFLGFINQKGAVVQLGDPDEVDGFNYEKSEMLFNDHLNIDRGWVLNQGITPPVTAVREQKGKVVYVEESPGEGYVKVIDYGPEIEKGWRGAAITREVPVDSNGEYAKNWKCNYRMDFNTDGASSDAVANSQVGHNSVTFSDQNDEIICSVVIEDNNRSKQKSDLAIYVKNERVWDTRETNSFYITGRGGDALGVKVEKFGNTITFTVTFGKVVKSITRTFDDSIVLRKVTWYGAVYGKGNPPMTNNLLRAIHVVKHNVPKYEDIPNKFQPGDIVTLDFSDGGGDIRVNGLIDSKLGAIGNHFFPLVPGENEVTCLWSNWTTEAPIIKFKHRGEFV